MKTGRGQEGKTYFLVQHVKFDILNFGWMQNAHEDNGICSLKLIRGDQKNVDLDQDSSNNMQQKSICGTALKCIY